jgi:hypothetical protein
VNPQIPADAFNSFFAWAPWIVGITIYGIFYVAKRRECAPVPVTVTNSGPVTSTFACTQCGRVGTMDQMVPKDRGGAVTYTCAACANS